MKTIAVIPCRYGSTRLPGKPLLTIGGKSLINIVYNSVVGTKLFDRVVVATDDERIFEHVKAFRAEVLMSPSDLENGTSRVAWVAKKIDAEFYVNIQGDEPFLTKKELLALLEAMRNGAYVATLAHRIDDVGLIEDPNCVKVIFDKDENAIYFSRLGIPFGANKKEQIHYRHIGVYGYTKEALGLYPTLQKSKIEQCEKLEQLRYLHNRIKVRVVKTEHFGIAIDQKSDLAKAEEILCSI